MPGNIMQKVLFILVTVNMQKHWNVTSKHWHKILFCHKLLKVGLSTVRIASWADITSVK